MPYHYAVYYKYFSCGMGNVVLDEELSESEVLEKVKSGEIDPENIRELDYMQDPWIVDSVQFEEYVPEPEPFEFSIENAKPAQDYMLITVPGKGVVQIKNADEGIVIDVYSPDELNPDQPVASTWAHVNELLKEEDNVD